jgi:hypothetical protein
MDGFECQFCEREFDTQLGMKDHQWQGKCDQKLKTYLGATCGTTDHDSMIAYLNKPGIHEACPSDIGNAALIFLRNLQVHT